MSTRNNSAPVKQSPMDKAKWFFVVILAVAGIYANYHFFSVPWAVRTAIGIVSSLLLAAVAFSTALGQKAWGFIKGGRTELRKVVWPSRQETVQTTVMVVVVVVIAALMLWGLDSIFMQIVASLIGQRG